MLGLVVCGFVCIGMGLFCFGLFDCLDVIVNVGIAQWDTHSGCAHVGLDLGCAGLFEAVRVQF